MKKTAILLFLAFICIFTAACRKKTDYSTPLSTMVPVHVQNQETGSSPEQTSTAVPAPVETPEPASTPTLAPAAPIPTVAPAPEAAPTIALTIKITKNPIGEIVDEGGKAIFIARADNAQSITWIIVSPDAKTYYEIDRCPSEFSPLKVQGQGTEKLILTEIPYVINGWRIQCYFTGNGGPAYTSGAIITVNKVNSQEAAAKTLAEDYKSVVQRYAEYSHWSMGGVENFIYYSEQNYGEHQLTLTRGAVNLVCTFDTYPADGTCYPVRLDWYENGKADLVDYYTFGSYDGESWNHFEKRILDITDWYGGGTAGQDMQ
ncbi:MAG: hypothetical protein Q4F31_04385 [Eubacteriales bacterium]|nr:hypothetical protein [Eubacteriales bacterium]